MNLPGFIDPAIMTASLSEYETNPLALYLFKLYGQFLSPEQIIGVMRSYNVGCARYMSGSTVWWQVDMQGRVRTGRVISYDNDSGSTTGGNVEWVHNLLCNRYPSFSPRHCFFGSHLLADAHPDCRILLFENEKDALMVALIAKAAGSDLDKMIIPIACPSITDFNFSTYNAISSLSPMRALRDRCVNIIPSHENYARWFTRSLAIPDTYASVRVSTILTPELRPSWLRYTTGGIEEIIVNLLHDRSCRPVHLADFLLNLYYGYCPVRDFIPA
ncbi:MAG: hypothetical protein K2G40_00715 [Muribaculaceae bacterium]|nr:hypothetical protein [Muribaculaceae bacterium]